LFQKCLRELKLPKNERRIVRMRIMINDGVRKTIGKCNECVFYNKIDSTCKHANFKKPMFVIDDKVIYTNCPLKKAVPIKQIRIDEFRIKVKKCKDCPVCSINYGDHECTCRHPKNSAYISEWSAQNEIGDDCPLEDYKKATKKVN